MRGDAGVVVWVWGRLERLDGRHWSGVSGYVRKTKGRHQSAVLAGAQRGRLLRYQSMVLRDNPASGKG